MAQRALATRAKSIRVTFSGAWQMKQARSVGFFRERQASSQCSPISAGQLMRVLAQE